MIKSSVISINFLKELKFAASYILLQGVEYSLSLERWTLWYTGVVIILINGAFVFGYDIHTKSIHLACSRFYILISLQSKSIPLISKAIKDARTDARASVTELYIETEIQKFAKI